MEEDLTIGQIQQMLESSPFIRFLGLQAIAMDPEALTLTVSMPMRAELERRQGSGRFHGGPIASLIDCVGDFALVLVTKGAVPTVNFRVDFLRPSMGDSLVATAQVRRAGRTIGVVDVDVHDAEERLVAIGRGCYGMATG